MSRAPIALLENATATGSAASWPGGRGTFAVNASAWAGTAKLQFRTKISGVTSSWIDAGADATFTADGGCNFELPACEIRVSVSGGSPTALYAYALPMFGARMAG